MCKEVNKMFNPLKYFRNRRVGLALGSGGSKGVAHIAVIEYLRNMGIPIHMIAGSSIGAVVGALYATGNLEKFKEDLLRKTKRDFYGLVDPVFPRSGLVQGRGFINYLAEYIPAGTNIEDLSIPLGVVATDFSNGKSVVFRSGNLLEALRASISIPGVLVPVRYEGTWLLDGGVANPLPVNVVKNMGAGITIAVNLHPRLNKPAMMSYLRDSVDRGGVVVDSGGIINEGDGELKTDSAGQAGWLKSVEQWLGLNKKQKESPLPNIVETITQAIDIMEFVNTALVLEFYKPSVLIEPNLVDVSSLDFSDVSRLLTEGYHACTRARKALVRNVKIWV